ncbi:ribosomal protein S18-alanine N-acetyltransferase [Vagococcus xieshaowenii]|uniref:[Ribosomal protein bS18]-alanine N-acetyltransferase n=1 Tax=Vagococcus xieshaowenii TaxID=2562451 RepID=A0A4Z0DBM0_9ENTE|nr:ribosomal protein S18-alanine N-acetyltransferase [Vagococcus xieshaowenii]QCA28356.1 ribosomal-protein-alanine N-acetyltransferase [Vagococcus xieshaowenii]TFZ42256.1 ribosomal-protein-alanine N-acetyltransferase [Vagococcus xieshaowenii]
MSDGLANQLWQVAQASFTFGSPWTIEQFEEDLQNKSSSWLLKRNESNEVVAFLQYRVVLDEAEIYHIAVSSAYQSQGLGKDMLYELIETLTETNVEKIFLEVRESNEQARRFYQKHAFVEIGVRKNYYHHPIDNGLMLMKELK